MFWILRNYFHESDRAEVHGKRAVNIEMWGRGAGHQNISEMRPAIILRNYFRHQYPHRPGRGQNVRICVDPVSWPNRTPEQIESKSCVFGWARPFRRLQTEVQSGGGGAGDREHRRGTAAREGGQGSGSPIVPGPRKSASCELWVYLLGDVGISFRPFDLIIFWCCLSGRSA